MRAAQRAAVRHARAMGERLEPEFEPEHRPFPCMFVCADCGQLHPPKDPTQGHPTRRSADAMAQPETPCSHCQSHAWIDLTNVPMTDVLRSSEREQDRKRPHALIVMPLFLGFLGGLVTMMADSSTGIPGWVVVGEHAIPMWPLVAVTFFVTSLGSRLWQARKGARKLPHRWSLSPTPSSGPRMRGRARGIQTLSAPLTDRPCVAYELAIHTANDSNAALGEFTLVEQRCADLEVDDRPFRGAGIRLVLRRERVELDPTNEAHRRAMHVRGLEAVGDGFTVYETIIAPDTLVAISGSETGATLRAAA